MRMLVAGTSWVASEHREWLARQWVQAAATLNPGARMLLVDSASPGELPEHPALEILQLGDNIGHLESTSRDGWGRATMTMLARAAGMEVDWIGVWDADVLMVKPLAEMVAAMQQAGIQVASCPATPYLHWIEGIFVFEAEWLRRNLERIVKTYDWEGMQKGIFPEVRTRQAMGKDLRLFSLRGCRDDLGAISVENLWQSYPAGIDYLTHCSKIEVYRAIMGRYGIPEAVVAIRHDKILRCSAFGS